MLILAAHHAGHTFPALLGFLLLLGSLGLGCWLLCALQRRSHRVVAALTALSLAAVSYAWLKHESDTWWERRCGDSHKQGCGDGPPIFPFGRQLSD